jgi:hypothetical protein
VPPEFGLQRESIEPAWRPLRAIKFNHRRCSFQIVGKALLLERGLPADHLRRIEESLKRYDDLLPIERTVRAAIDATGWLMKPSCFHILTAERGGITMALQPCGVDEETLGQLLELV